MFCCEQKYGQKWYCKPTYRYGYMHACIHAHIYIHTFIHTHTYICIYIYICVYIYIYVRYLMCMPIHMHTCTHICIYTHLHKCMCLDIHITNVEPSLTRHRIEKCEAIRKSFESTTGPAFTFDKPLLPCFGFNGGVGICGDSYAQLGPLNKQAVKVPIHKSLWLAWLRSSSFTAHTATSVI